MNTLLLNRDGFQMPADGWYQVAPLGEFAHAGAGVVQVVDQDACVAMVNRFAADAAGANFAGLLVDFDHFSLDGEKRSEAAGWITALENRDGGLFAQIRWSDLGEEAVRGGRYRFLSPVWSRSDCQDLGGGRVRPVRLLNAAVTNDPNLKGMRPLSNSVRSAEGGTRNAESGDVSHIGTEGTETGQAVGQLGGRENAQRPTGVVANAAVARFKWMLSGDGKHCPSCAAVAGQVHTMAEWDAAGIRPGGGALYCLGKCKCRLVETQEASGGAVTGVVKRHRPVGNRLVVGNGSTVHGSVVAAVREAKRAARAGMMANQGWTDEARAASLAVRRAKAEARQKLVSGTEKKKGRAYTRPELGRLFQDVGYDAMTPDQIDNYVEFIRQRLMDAPQSEPSEVERAFLREYSDAVPKMTDQNDPVQRWCVEYRRFAREVTAKTGMLAKEALQRYQAILKQKGGVKGHGYLKKDDYTFFKAYRWALDAYRDGRRMRELDQLTAAEMELFQDSNDRMKALIKIDTERTKLRAAAKLREDWHSGKITSDAYYQILREKYMKTNIQNRWSDTARKASLAVRKAKAMARKQKAGARPINPDAGQRVNGEAPDTGIYLGGSKYFDEATGRYVWPKKKRRWEK